MGKAHSRSTVTGGTYILSGCVNARFWNSSEESLWRQETSAGGSTARSQTPQRGGDQTDHTKCQQNGGQPDCSAEKIKVGFAEDMCPFEVSLPPELGGSKCSVRVTTAKSETPNGHEPSMSPTNSSSKSASTNKATIGAVDCDISLDAATDTQEWSFTLYDFEGHQKVTREDLTSLLKTISEALAKTVTLPPSGRRKLKLSLSVVSDQDSEPSSKQKFAFSSQVKPSTIGPNSQVKSKRKHLNRQRGGEEDGEEMIETVHDKTFPNHGKKKRERRQRRHQRSHSYSYADDGARREEKNQSRRKSRNRRNNSSSTFSDANLQNGANEFREEVTIQQQQCSFHPRENPERRTYYRELAGIENTSNSFTESDNIDRLSRTLPDTKRSGKAKACPHRRSRSCDRESGNSNQEVQIEKRRSKVVVNNGDNVTGAVLPKSGETNGKQKKCQTVLAPGASPYTGHFGMQNLVIPLSACTSPVEVKRGKHRTKKHTVKPFTYMEHEILGTSEGIIQVPVPVPTKHHHRHEHHHHYHHHHHYQ